MLIEITSFRFVYVHQLGQLRMQRVALLHQCRLRELQLSDCLGQRRRPSIERGAHTL